MITRREISESALAYHCKCNYVSGMQIDRQAFEPWRDRGCAVWCITAPAAVRCTDVLNLPHIVHLSLLCWNTQHILSSAWNLHCHCVTTARPTKIMLRCCQHTPQTIYYIWSRDSNSVPMLNGDRHINRCKINQTRFFNQRLCAVTSKALTANLIYCHVGYSSRVLAC